MIKRSRNARAGAAAAQRLITPMPVVLPFEVSTRRKHETSGSDLDRLRYALSRDSVDLNRSLFDPNGMTWRINREGAIVLGGGCALLLQVAHPLVAAGVQQYSNFRANPLERLWRTLDLMLTIDFGTAAQALTAVRTIERRHARVGGVLDEAVGPFAAGTAYNANDPELQLWVHATLVDTALRVYEMLIEPLQDEARAAYYEESKITARLFGIPEQLIPRRWADFRLYWSDMIQGDKLAVSAAGRAVAESIMTPPLPLGVREVFQLPHIFTLGLLPAKVRESYGYGWGMLQEILLGAAVKAGQYTLPWLPEMVRMMPSARRAKVRAAA